MVNGYVWYIELKVDLLFYDLVGENIIGYLRKRKE